MTKQYEPFDSRGRFVAPTPEQIEALDESKRERLETLRSAALAAEQAERDLVTAQIYVTTCANSLRDARIMRSKVGPKMTQVELAKQHIALRRQGLAS